MASGRCFSWRARRSGDTPRGSCSHSSARRSRSSRSRIGWISLAENLLALREIKRHTACSQQCNDGGCEALGLAFRLLPFALHSARIASITGLCLAARARAIASSAFAPRIITSIGSGASSAGSSTRPAASSTLHVPSAAAHSSARARSTSHPGPSPAPWRPLRSFARRCRRGGEKHVVFPIDEARPSYVDRTSAVPYT